jgi:prepilin-type processing-associated H-X9-DG protein
LESDYPDLQFVGDRASLAANGPNLLCPSEPESDNPLDYSTRHIQGSAMPPRHIRVTSYCGNAGTRSYHPDSGFFMADGIFIMAGPDSQPRPNQNPITLAGIVDGTSNTLFFGERSRWDPNYNSFAAQGWDWPLRFYGNWCGASRLVVSHLTLSGYSPINYRLPFNYTNRAIASPPANSPADFKYYIDLRLCAYGSSHPGGANISLADGSVRFFSETISMVTLRALSTRAGGEPEAAQ